MIENAEKGHFSVNFNLSTYLEVKKIPYCGLLKRRMSCKPTGVHTWSTASE